MSIRAGTTGTKKTKQATPIRNRRTIVLCFMPQRVALAGRIVLLMRTAKAILINEVPQVPIMAERSTEGDLLTRDTMLLLFLSKRGEGLNISRMAKRFGYPDDTSVNKRRDAEELLRWEDAGPTACISERTHSQALAAQGQPQRCHFGH